ncbi:phosphate ABC transporter, inner membrane subunit PstA [Xylanimonas cellulosilytica DSM 15894]|uniref:Phosphate transport system permease protein PstA n=1 Tax=Xylanimonas cellulosilytica (strain DSM 15894 / JCM 12276 / CECT 5975 / KCTC 9989 / LMG 20990 / NBRC 107835 / XIL07) TaxID=446471 RepID=D1BZ71_XYLCX|nr:phosphate ABC transporter permease PstA [Xylanimonas cellulosilytica]ACZ31968.1 phosphate ABC transporter, inner membrane subunit PstA [Xylanimonas cellulosilytica DSM 15894]
MSATTFPPVAAPSDDSGARVRAMLTTADAGRRRTDRLVTVLVCSAFALAMIPLVSLLWTVAVRGAEKFGPYFLSVSMRGVFGGMDSGGIYHAIVGTLLITLCAAVISVPIGLLTAIYLVEYGHGALARATTFFVDVMTGIPSIVAGLFAYALFAIFFGPGVRLGIAAGVALSVLMIPVVVRSCEEMLRLVPNELREASYALGVPRWLTIIKVVLRTSVAGLTTGVLLSVARVIGETAPILITAGIANSINFNPFEGRMATLPVFIFSQYRQGVVPCRADVENCLVNINELRAWAAALTLILIVMLLNLLGRLVTRLFAPKLR